MKRTRTVSLTLVVASGLLASPVAASSTEHIRVEPISTAAPTWFTPALAQRALDAGEAGVPLPQDANIPMSSLAFTGIRPGQQIIVTDADDLLNADSFALCSANHVFKSSNDRVKGKARKARRTTGSTYAIGTAGHCGGVGDKVFMIFAPLGVVYIGDIIKSTFSENRLAPDFALIAIEPSLNEWVSPSMAHWGGPTGPYTAEEPTPIVHSGHGIGVGTGGTPRAGYAYGWFGGGEYRFEGVISNGDSGSGANTVTGLAVGNITHIAVDTREDIPVWFGGTSIETILGLVGGWELATCSVAIPWPLPGCPPV